MPYSVPLPAPAPLPVHSQGRVGHRRSYTTERGPGAFAPLRLLPRRAQGPVFHFRNDEPEHDDDDDDSSSQDEDSHPPPVKFKANPIRLTVNTTSLVPPVRQKTSHSVPFPRSSPQSTPQSSTLQLPSPHGIRPQVARTSSTPILLSNGKPLKSSLKSSSSSPNIPSNHLRTRSAPATPHPDRPSSPEDDAFTAPPTPKNVHFPSKDSGGLETILIFSKSAKPASLSRSGSFCDDTETDETEGEGYSGRTSFPFPRFPGSSPIREDITASLARGKETVYELDTANSSVIPAPSASPYGNVYLETLNFVNSPSPALVGSLLVRNLAYEKQVAVRFTLDDWVTTSEVVAHHVVSLSALPPTFASKASLTVGDVIAAHSDRLEWDRFEFTIRLADYSMKLESRVVWLVARFGTPGDGDSYSEWWDNNHGGNYRVAFRKKEVEPPVRERKERTLSAPAALPAQAPAAPAVPTVNVLPAYSPPMTYQTPDQHQAVTQTTLSRLKRLNLKNYAAPTAGSQSPSSASSSPIRTPPSSSVPVPVAKNPAKDLSSGTSPSLAASPPFSTMGSSPHGTGVGWSWGASAARPAFEIGSKQDEDGKLSTSSSSDSISSSSDGLRTPPLIHSPRPSSLLLSVDDNSGTLSPLRKSPSPPLPHQRTSTSARPSSRSPSPSSDSGTDSEPITHTPKPTPRPALSEDPDSVYQAFVRKWCFAAGPGRIATV